MRRPFRMVLASTLLFCALAAARSLDEVRVVPLAQARRLKARLVCADSARTWRLGPSAVPLYLTIPADRGRPSLEDRAELSFSAPACHRAAVGGGELDLVVANDSVAFHPEDSAGTPTSARLIILLKETDDGSAAKRLGKGHNLLYSCHGQVRQIPVLVWAPSQRQAKNNLETVGKVLAAPFVGAYYVVKYVLIGVGLVIASPFILIMMLAGGFVCSGSGCH